MKRLLPILCCSLLAASALGSEQIREVQTELKSQGFYYGDVTGNESTELTAAVRRYQIRNGLEVTGTLNAPTLRSLDVAGAPTAPPTKPSTPTRPAESQRPKTATAPTPATRPPVNLRREDDDRQFLERETPPRRPYSTDRSIVPPPASLEQPFESSGRYADVFAGTPYATAPKEVQEQTVRRAQMALTNQGYYVAGVDGDPGPATEEAILAFQRSSRLPLTGRLDLQTLAQLRLLPGRGTGNPALRPFNSPRERERPSNRVYRGVWVE